MLQAYGPFGSIGAPLLSYASQRLGLDRATTAEVLLQYLLTCCDSLVVKSENSERIRRNFNCLQYSVPEVLMQELDDMDDEKHYCWDPQAVL